MTTTKPRTEVPKIMPVADQEFVLTREEVSQACANFVLANRRNCRFKEHHNYVILCAEGAVRITLQQVKDK